ncbi:hypothetical protein BURPS1106B_A2376 [Burkholderia pseudomallei 1106b]|uniref:Uncharacterized protein n=1 Tax=Burkholderia pseudomallei (strain 1106a) TaxID=357348 RepID=A3NYH9_BURP0|nr:hypothetical protein BURPS1106A_3162 [Burkholderia pseudomallei 1106a]AFR17049.1 hypothetical protein BPC006_I3203 [Burkholderia pseudomallei BPC006]EES27102.1 hypothetical protein BURPS1106B_A2376 [Burkholderia pseudomallei 1106b]
MDQKFHQKSVSNHEIAQEISNECPAFHETDIFAGIEPRRSGQTIG